MQSAKRQQKLSLDQELAILATWKEKSSGVTGYEWDGQTLTINTVRGKETFSRQIVIDVIFNNFKP